MDQIGKPNAKTLQLDEVKLGENYALVISTNGGLWRYLIGDTIAFTSLDPFRIKVTGRTKHFINAFGEELIVDNAEKAIAEASKVTGAIVRDYTAAPVYMQGKTAGAHEWAIEFEKHPEDFDAFIVALDAALKKLNSDYEAKRFMDKILRLPIIHAVPDQTFYRWMKARGKLGGQNKVPRLSNQRDYLEQILEEIHA